MKKRVVLLLTCLFLWVSSIFAQDVPVGVVVAFKKGNSQELTRYLGDKVDLIIQKELWLIFLPRTNSVASM